MNNTFNASDYKNWLDAVMAASQIIKTLTTKEEVDEIKKQIKDTWPFVGKWEYAAPMLNGVSNMQLRKLYMEKNTEK